MKFFTKAFIASFCLLSPALFANSIQLVGRPSYSVACGEGSDLVIADGNKIELVIPAFEAVAAAGVNRVRKNCVITAKIKAPVGYKIAPGTLNYEGNARIAQGGSGNITARYYFTGTESLAGYRSFDSNYNDIFTVSTEGHSERYTTCGGTAEFNFMGDIVARGENSEVVVQRGNADVDVSQDTPVVQCGVKVVRCR